MRSSFKQLSIEKRNDIQSGLNLGLSCRALARRLQRPQSTVREKVGK